MTNRKTYITVLNVVSCLGVVLLHTANFWNFNKTRGWVAANFVESFFYFAVPVFIMISGATLVDFAERYTMKQYFEKRVKKTVIPFFAWSVISIIFAICCRGIENVSLNPIDIINAIIGCQYMGIYYFFLVIFGIYLSIPVIGSIEKEKRKKIFEYAIIVFFVVNSLLPFLASMSGGRIVHNSNFSFYVCSSYLIYVFIGYYIDNYEMSRRTQLLIYALGALGFLVHFVGTWYLSFRNNEVTTLFKGYMNVPCILYSAAIFLLFKKIPFEKFPEYLLKVITFFSGQTFGIYLIHIFLITIADKCFGIAPVRFVPSVLFAFVIFMISGFLIKIMQKIPIIKHIIP